MKFLLKSIVFVVFFVSCNKITKSEKPTIELSKDSIKLLTKKEERLPILSDKLEITKIKLKCRGNGTRAASVFGSGVTIYFTIKNTSKLGIRRILFNGSFKFKGRNYIFSDKINYEFRKGLEPGEVLDIAMRPSSLSDWNSKIKPGDKGDLILKIIEIEDYMGTMYK